MKRVKNHGKRMWRARVVFRGHRKVAYRATKDEAPDQ